MSLSYRLWPSALSTVKRGACRRQVARALVQPNDTVLELGARFGTTSCELAAATRNTGFVVSVEPDVDAVPYLLQNRRQQQCAFHILQDVVGQQPVVFWPSVFSDGYSSATTPAPERMSPQSTQRKIAARAFTQIESLIGGRRFNVALVDCEGCIDFSLSPELLQQLDFLLWEEDGHSVISNRRWYHRLTAYGFLLHWRIHDTFDPRRQAWSRLGVHSAWVKRSAASARKMPSCGEYKAKHKLDDDMLHCGNANLVNGSKLARQAGMHAVHFASGLAKPNLFDHTCEYDHLRERPLCRVYRGLRAG